MVDDTEYGLAASVWTSDLDRAHRVAQQMHVGIAWVNTRYLRDLRSPFGGVGMSGIGREGDEYSMHFCNEPTNVCIRLSDPAPRFGGVEFDERERRGDRTRGEPGDGA